MIDLAIVQFQKFIAETVFLWRSGADIHKRRTIQVGFSWIPKCSFWPSRRHYQEFHSLMSKTVFNVLSLNLIFAIR